MSVSGISSSSFLENGTHGVQNKQAQIGKEFKKLGQDLQSGNVSAAQSDFSVLQQLVPKLNSSSTPQNYDPLVQAFNQLGKNLQSGNTSAAQQDYAKIQQVFENRAQQVHDNTQSPTQAPADSTGLSVNA
jgi:hypothetical protein